MEKQRCYMVIDMKSFFASVECAERGLDAMKTKLIVADPTRTKSTICLAVSPALKKLGVKNRCRLYEVPTNIKYIIAPPRMNKYIQYASNIYSIYLKYMSKEDIHVYSIDECILDVTDYLKIYKMRAIDFAKLLMKEIFDNLHIPSSAGIGTNMYLAKIALDITAKKSPDRIGYLTEEKFKKELWNHRPITDFWGISKGIATRLSKMAIYDMEGIAKYPEEYLYKEFGINAEILIDHSKGIETCLMSDIKAYKTKSKSISSSQILPCGYSFDDAKIILQEMITEGCYRLEREKYVTNLINVFVMYDDDLITVSHASKRMKETTNLNFIISPYAVKLYEEIVDKCRKVRRVGFSFSNLLPIQFEQYDLFTNIHKVEEEHRLTNCILYIKDKFGKNAVLKGIDLFENATARERNNQIGGHRVG